MSILSILNNLNQMCYIDPAATSVLLSSITAIVIAVGASAIVLWRKFKKKVSKTLHIDPNAGKEVEEDIVVNDEEDGEEYIVENDDEEKEEKEETK